MSSSTDGDGRLASSRWSWRAIMGLWIRTTVAVDILDFEIEDQRHTVMSCEGGLVWQLRSIETRYQTAPFQIDWTTISADHFQLGDNSLSEAIALDAALYLNSRYLVILYWWIALPLTLLCAYLLLWNPRSKPK